ncbi:MAG: methylmalonyl Co-A mutase-associated GTPase MeaB [Acidothermus cellulolyticus]|nr:methylmalonyl Co-A mutase-associated GTPase MeaB [Acidothermus cellulolyticus]
MMEIPAAARGAALQRTVAAARTGDPRAIGRLLSLVENTDPVCDDAPLQALWSAFPRPLACGYVLGVTGAPGVGKSTLVAALIAAFRRDGMRVGVLAVDPSSPFTGGALLGDRIRMHAHTTDPGVFLRSMAARGHLGGLAPATPMAIRLLEALGFDVVLVETVGVGQGEIAVARAVDTTLVVTAPGLGDAVQAAKAGVLEIADIFVVNKADHPGADQTVRELRQTLAVESSGPDGWRRPVVRTVATRGDIDELVAAVRRHRDRLAQGGRRDRRRRRAADDVRALVFRHYAGRLTEVMSGAEFDALADRVAAGELDLLTAVRAVLADTRAAVARAVSPPATS